MTGHERFKAALAMCLIAGVAFLSAFAQETDGDSTALAEEMLVEDVLNGDLQAKDDTGLDALLEEASVKNGESEPELAIGEAVAEPVKKDFEETAQPTEVPVFEEAPSSGTEEDAAFDLTVESALEVEQPPEEKGTDETAGEPAAEDLLGREIEETTVVEEAAAEPAKEISIEDLLMEGPREEPSEVSVEPAEPEKPAPAAVEAPAEAPASAERPMAAPEPFESRPVARVTDSDREGLDLTVEMEKLRRKALEDHAREKVEEARKAFNTRRYLDAKQYFEQAQGALKQAGDRPATREMRDQIKIELREAIYQQSIAFMKGGDLESALKFATEATFQGHRKGPALVEQVKTRIEEAKLPVPPPPRPVRWEQPDFVESEKETASMLKTGREQFMSAELDAALATFEAVLKKDPNNTEAIRWRAKVSQRKFEVASLELESTRRDMIADVRRNWNPRDYGPADALARIRPPGETRVDEEEIERRKIIERMKAIVIPEIDFRQANIYDVVQFLQDNSREWDPDRKGVNIILHLGEQEAAPAPVTTGFFGAVEAQPGVKEAGDVPLITFRARDVTLFEALKIVTEVASLKYRIEDRVVKIVPLDAPIGKIISRMYNVLPTLKERMTIVGAELDKGVDDFGGTFGRAAVGGEATDWKDFFRGLGVEWPQGSSIRYLPTIGKMMVANTAENLAVFEQRLSELDVVPKQIEIETRFVEVNQRDMTSMGFEYLLTDNWELLEKDGQENLHPTARERIQVNATSFTKGQRYLTDNLLSGNPVSAADNILTMASVLTNPELAFVLHLLQQKGNADLLSAPKVTTQSGVEAMIKVVTEYVYPGDYDITSGTSATFQGGEAIQVGTPPVVTPRSFETREVGVILSVLPEVSAEGQMINLTMTPEVVSEPEWRNYGQSFTDADGNTLSVPIEQPFFKTRSLSTSISIYNGATVVMGGLIHEMRVEVDDKIPFLGDLPVIGRMFTSKYESSEKRNLLIFVTARLVDPAGNPIGKIEEIMDKISPVPEAE